MSSVLVLKKSHFSVQILTESPSGTETVITVPAKILARIGNEPNFGRSQVNSQHWNLGRGIPI